MVTRVVNITKPGWRKGLDMMRYHYCGRGSVYGNQFRIGVDGTRQEVIAKHKAWVLSQPDFVRRIKQELTDGILGCFCHPLDCHCDTYVEICDAGRRN